MKSCPALAVVGAIALGGCSTFHSTPTDVVPLEQALDLVKDDLRLALPKLNQSRDIAACGDQTTSRKVAIKSALVTLTFRTAISDQGTDSAKLAIIPIGSSSLSLGGGVSSTKSSVQELQLDLSVAQPGKTSNQTDSAGTHSVLAPLLDQVATAFLSTSNSKPCLSPQKVTATFTFGVERKKEGGGKLDLVLISLEHKKSVSSEQKQTVKFAIDIDATPVIWNQ